MKVLFCLAAGAALGAGGYYYLRKKTAGLLGEATVPIQSIGVHLRQIRRYAFASSQDISPIVGITHASYALVLLDTLEEVVGRDNAKRAGIDAAKLRAFITGLQDQHAEKLKSCDPHLQKILDLERREGMQVPGFVVAGAPMGA